MPVEIKNNIVNAVTAAAIRDTNNYFSASWEGKNYTKHTVVVNNGLNQSVDVGIEVSKDGTTWFNGGTLVTGLTAGSGGTYGTTTLPVMNAPMPYFRLRIKATTAPTSGVVDAWVVQSTV